MADILTFATPLALGAIILLLLLQNRKSGQSANNLSDSDLAEVEELRSQNTNLMSKLARIEALETEKAQEIGRLSDKLEEAQANMLALSESKARIEATAKSERAAAEKQLSDIAAIREDMERKFREMSVQAVKQQGAEITKLGTQTWAEQFSPLKELIDGFKRDFKDSNQETIKERKGLEEQIKQLMAQTNQVSSEANALTKALKGDTQKQGAWGELILERLLELSGMEEGREYSTQQSYAGSEQERLRPDVIVNLPENKHLVIDSKVSLVAFEAFQTAESEAEADLALKQHLQSIKSHIKGLSGKNYEGAVEGSLDYVIMFVPIEGAFAAALKADPELTSYAAGLNIAIATPNTLLMALRTVANLWKVEKRNRNADEIAKKAGQLYDKIYGFIENFEKVGRQLETAQKTFDTAKGQLHTGAGNVTRRAEELKKLGAKASKQLRDDLIDADDNASHRPLLQNRDE